MSTVLDLGSPPEEEFAPSTGGQSHATTDSSSDAIAAGISSKIGQEMAGQPIENELYGPLMLVFTLVAVLLFGMKSTGHVVREGTLIGTAIGISFFYLFGVAFLLFTVAYFLSVRVSLVQMISLTGYGLFGPCLTLLLAAIWPSDNEMVFYALWLVLCGLSALRIALVLGSRTLNRQHSLLLGGLIMAFQLLFVLYLHFAYAHLYQTAAETIQLLEGGVDAPRIRQATNT